jgi:hypothetical protein
MKKRREAKRSRGISIPAREFKQNGQFFYNLEMPHDMAVDLVYSVEFTERNKGGDQRPLSQGHVKQYTRAVNDEGATHARSVMATLTNGARVVRGRGYSSSRLTNPVRIVIPSPKGQYFRLQDGHHGVEAVDKSRKKRTWVWPLTLSSDDSLEGMRRRHADLNTFQLKPSKAVIMYMTYLHKRLPQPMMRFGKVISSLARDRMSVMFDRITMFHNQRPRDKKSGSRIGFNNIVALGGEIGSVPGVMRMPYKKLRGVVATYYRAWMETRSHEWCDNTGYMLGDLMGFRSITHVMPMVLQRVIDLRGSLTPDNVYAETRLVAQDVPEVTWARKPGSDHGYQAEGAIYKEIKKQILIGAKRIRRSRKQATVSVKARKVVLKRRSVKARRKSRAV